ncbi:hypothetical protein [Parageobacillus thermoglucosidasius]|uniref:Uncharacterized protein n=1 Tax=Parageobacillus thermoglucosidasius TaxID=1426 RepID=A0A1B7KRR2_PARTM|nr:hypothetical protein [Parageobacillus thermoglucosidasius]OAT72778.1 hypothetical protein A7K69_07505 [Parageobacillus thermoglucosidasius]
MDEADSLAGGRKDYSQRCCAQNSLFAWLFTAIDMKRPGFICFPFPAEKQSAFVCRRLAPLPKRGETVRALGIQKTDKGLYTYCQRLGYVIHFAVEHQSRTSALNGKGREKGRFE